MSYDPKKVEEKMLKVLDAWRTLAPGKSFGGMTLAQYEAQVENSLEPRTRLKELSDQTIQQITQRDDEDTETMTALQRVIAGIVADPTEGDNSALYEACGYVRKDNRKSGLTRKKVAPIAEKVKS